MIYKAKYADRDHYIQTNNAIEAYNKKVKKDSYLETCGPSAMINCCQAVSENELTITINNQNVKAQPEDLVFLIMNNPENYSSMLPYRENFVIEDFDIYIPSRIPQLFVWAARTLFNISSRYFWNYTAKPFENIAGYIKKGCSVQLQLVSPGHFISVGKYDSENDILIYEDSWPDRWPDKSGKNRVLTREEFMKNTHRFYNVYYPQGEVE